MDRDDWYATSLLVVSGFLIGLMAITDIPLETRLIVDGSIGVPYSIFSIAYFLKLRHPSSTLATSSQPVQGRRRWIDKFRRQDRISARQFWIERVAFMIGLGSLVIGLGWSLEMTILAALPSSAPLQIRLEEYGIIILFFGLGVVLVVSSVLRGTAEVSAILEKRRAIKNARQTSWQRWLENFNDDLYNFNNSKDAKERDASVSKLSAYLSNLVTNEKGVWPAEVQRAILNLVGSIQKGFPAGDILYRIQCSALLRLAYTKRDSIVNAEIVKQFRETFENVSDSELNMDLSAFLLRQEMHEFGEQFMMKLIDQSIYDWDNERFGKMWEHIRLDQLKARNSRAIEGMKEHLRTIWQDKQKGETVRYRASRLLDQAKRIS